MYVLVKLLKNDLPSMEIEGRVSPAVSVGVKAISRKASPAILKPVIPLPKPQRFYSPNLYIVLCIMNSATEKSGIKTHSLFELQQVQICFA